MSLAKGTRTLFLNRRYYLLLALPLSKKPDRLLLRVDFLPSLSVCLSVSVSDLLPCLQALARFGTCARWSGDCSLSAFSNSSRRSSSQWLLLLPDFCAKSCSRLCQVGPTIISLYLFFSVPPSLPSLLLCGAMDAPLLRFEPPEELGHAFPKRLPDKRCVCERPHNCFDPQWMLLFCVHKLLSKSSGTPFRGGCLPKHARLLLLYPSPPLPLHFADLPARIVVGVSIH